jgi:hypothetical protein
MICGGFVITVIATRTDHAGAPRGRPAEAPVHSSAGRIVSLRPLALAERGICVPTVSLADMFSGALPGIQGNSAVKLADYVREIVRSGLPGIRPLANGAAPRSWPAT